MKKKLEKKKERGRGSRLQWSPVPTELSAASRILRDPQRLRRKRQWRQSMSLQSAQYLQGGKGRSYEEMSFKGGFMELEKRMVEPRTVPTLQ